MLQKCTFIPKNPIDLQDITDCRIWLSHFLGADIFRCSQVVDPVTEASILDYRSKFFHPGIIRRFFVDSINCILICIFTQIFIQPESIIPAFIFCIAEKPQIPAKKPVDHRNGKCQDELNNVKQISRLYPFQFFKKCLFHLFF